LLPSGDDRATPVNVVHWHECASSLQFCTRTQQEAEDARRAAQRRVIVDAPASSPKPWLIAKHTTFPSVSDCSIISWSSTARACL